MPSSQPSLDERSREAVLAWFRPRRTAYPWRRTRDPYAVLVSEIMLQQTQAARVAAAFGPFLRRFPTVRALAAARRSDVLRAWGGLGYNRRAVALHEAARVIVREHEGRVPADPPALRRLPGVGPYTATATASLAFDAPVAAVDTNVRRITARVHTGLDEATPATTRGLADAWLDPRGPGAWNQALMDLGREVCRPRPRCEVCPLAAVCAFRARGAEPRPRRSRSEPFEGSNRQLRGAVIRVLRHRSPVTLGSLAREVDPEGERVRRVVAALAREGLVAAGPAAVRGRPGGRVRLPD